MWYSVRPGVESGGAWSGPGFRVIIACSSARSLSECHDEGEKIRVGLGQ
jgi:hypothetical protein